MGSVRFKNIILIISLLFISGSLYGVPYELSYGGRLTEASGKPVSGPVNLRVTFFRSVSGADQVAVAIPDFTGVALQEGVFQITLSLSAADFHTIFNNTDAAFIQIEDLSHSVTYPRQKFAAVPYALKVPVSGDSITYNADGELALGNGSNILTLPNAAGAANKVLKSDGAGALVWADDLTGGVGSITSTDIQDGTIVNADISATAAIAVSKISGLGDAATKNVGTGATNVAAGDHSHTDATTTTSGFLSASDKVRLNAAVVTTDTGTVTSTMISNGTIADADVSGSAAIATSKLSGAVTSIASHGLGDAATKNVGTGATNVAAGDHGHSAATTTVAGFMSAADKTKLEGIATGAGVDTNAKTLCADGEYLRGEDATTCRTSTQVVSDGGGVTTSDTGTVTGTMILNGTLENADISNTAAIAGSKINPDFGAQNIATTGAVTATGNITTSGIFSGNGSGLTGIPTPGTSGGAASNPTSGCPTGYLLVPGDAAFGTTDFCVMKYEAKFGKKGAESRAAGLPARRSVAWADAMGACRNLGPGYALLNNMEWMTIATNIANVNGNWSGGTVGSGALNRGHSDNAPADALAASTDDNAACTGTGQTCSSSVWDGQRRTHTLSNGGVIWDFAGNVWEWVDYYNDEDKPTPATAAYHEYTAVTGSSTMPKSEVIPTNAVKAWWSDSWNSTQNIGQLYPGTNGSGGALRRGGNWVSGTVAGVFAANLNYAPSLVSTYVGFRCGFRKAQ